MDFNTFKQLFIPFCETANVSSGKAKSYCYAIQYLANFLNLPDLGHGNAAIILAKEEEIGNRRCNFYQQWFDRLDDEGRSSYLVKGFAHAAIPFFREFATQNNLI